MLTVDGKEVPVEYFTEVSGGLRTPNGVSAGPDGHIIMPDNQGFGIFWMPEPALAAAFEDLSDAYSRYRASVGPTLLFQQ